MRYSPSVPTAFALSPCVLVLKTPVAARERVAERLIHTGRRLAGQVEAAAEEQELTLAAVTEALSRHGVTPEVFSVDALDAPARQAISRAALVITVGGDGTLLATSAWVTGAVLLGVNSAPRSSVGYLTVARRATFARILDRVARGTLQPQSVSRLEVKLDGRLLEPMLNDVLVAHDRPAATSRYRLRLGRQLEEHRSSGLWVATPAGSTAGIHSAGGQALPLAARELQFRARELYRGRNQGEARLASGFLKEGNRLVVESAMSEGWLFPDGSRRATPFPFGATAVFRLAEAPLRLFADPGRWPAARA